MPLEPLRAFPGHGWVALPFFSYTVCDNDPYNEASIAIVVHRPSASRSHALELPDSVRRRHFFAACSGVAVTTEVARVHGVCGYQLLKWLALIDVSSGSDVRASMAAIGGKPDIAISAPLPTLRNVPSQSRMGMNTMHHQDRRTMAADRRAIQHAFFCAAMVSERRAAGAHGGPMSDLLNGLGASKPAAW